MKCRKLSVHFHQVGTVEVI